MQITIPVELLNLLLRLARSWIAKYELRDEDVELFEALAFGLVGNDPPMKREPQMASEMQLELFGEIRKIA